MTTFFEGPAGTGKTTSVIEAVRQRVASRGLADHEAVLALTFMHGSRRRLASRLVDVPELRTHHECSTIDSFAWGTVVRWKSLARALGLACGDLAETDYDRTCAIAANLVDQEQVAGWIRRKFPILIVDEMQDCRDQRLSLIQTLTRAVESFVAADDFQDLNGEGDGPAVQWLRANSNAVSLTINRRTNVQELLDAALAVRDGEPVVSNGRFRVFDVYNHNVAASRAACNFVWYWGERPVVLSPNRSDTSTLVRQTCARLASGPIKPGPLNGKSVGPFAIRWADDGQRLENAILTELGLPANDGPALAVQAPRQGPSAMNFIRRRMAYYCRLNHVNSVPSAIMRRYVTQAVQTERAYGARHLSDHGIRAMTIHQAKNREFDSVIVLWPFEVGGSEERQRRLLYNAITRARHRVTVLVQSLSPQKRRSEQPPFSIVYA